jgi:hypothetical protein
VLQEGAPATAFRIASLAHPPSYAKYKLSHKTCCYA